ncbi:type I-E CRISPR-associated protein Cse2/CasB [Solimonas sp. K1W22B-7]|uniref:type I-E CRISPR-associated protein Cse2/CasB n=1 Tax=Solimonas sp. K1W22B-7 TaxID=2303331 RepID=UPI000E3371C1|nr:type I-E CRISPR-associated protein Cse2/CasB [Solimonas sp. K1W22B-7]AXQ28792.1 type I-E CRISPR-associated protein Cse2/CasB [Solimonas sp. K1W22B-7]
MSAFIVYLEKLNEADSKVRAVLRRSLAFEPGQYVPAYPYVEPFVQDDDAAWRRTAHHLVAGLWAAHWREGRGGPSLSLAEACAAHQLKSGSASTERRLINLLDADRDQLSHRLRQMVALLADQAIDFAALLDDLLKWQYDRKPTQNKWARAFYKALAPIPKAPATETETTK